VISGAPPNCTETIDYFLSGVFCVASLCDVTDKPIDIGHLLHLSTKLELVLLLVNDQNTGWLPDNNHKTILIISNE
jgi:hypothetical protein